MARRTFAHRAETFGFDTVDPWALDAFRMLFHVPRAYQPLVDAWDVRYPGTLRALDRLVEMGFVAYQPALVLDTRTGQLGAQPSRKVARYRTTAAGHRLADRMREDIRELEDEFAHLTPANVKGLARLLSALDLEDSHAKYGLSCPHAVDLSELPARSGRWWLARLVDLGYVRELPERYADVREVVPAHWRVTRLLCRQLRDVIGAFDGAPGSLEVEFRLKRSRFLDDIDPARVGISGATDFDHDVECQRILAAILRSPRCAPDGIFTVEPRINLPVETRRDPWVFTAEGASRLFYQPDAEIREIDEAGPARRSIIEYERYQTRRDAWDHVERFLGYLHTMALGFEPAVLRFVVDSDARIRSYVPLIEAFTDYILDHPDRLPPNPVTLAVTSAPRLLAAEDPLDPRGWHRITLPAKGADTSSRPVLHRKATPYDEYFSRG